MVNDSDIQLGSKVCKVGPKVKLSIADSILLVNRNHWDAVLNQQDLFLHVDYLSALEKSMEASIEFRYVVYYCEEFNPIGIAYFQVADLIDTGSKYAGAVKRLGKGIGSHIVSELKVRALVSGNVFHCGEHGFRFSDKLNHDEQISIIESTLNRLKRDGDLESKASIVLFKEFWPESFEFSEKLLDSRYHMFRMDMNMMLDLRPSWTSFEEYLKDLTSKSRTRLKSTLKRSDALRFESMDTEAIAKAIPRFTELFKEVLTGSPFTFGVLEMETYVHWKKLLGDKLQMTGVYLEDKMVGFMSAFVNGEDLEVHYVGIDYSKNEEFAIYQRMLIEFLKSGINTGVKRIGFGRTAEQAKSSLGAVPVEMRLYTKHRNIIANRLISSVMNSVVPTEFEQRHPFKKQ